MDDVLKQEYFISEDGYINVCLKVTTDDIETREKIVAELMKLTYNQEGFSLPEHTKVEKLYFGRQNPETVIDRLEKDITQHITNTFKNIKNNVSP